MKLRWDEDHPQTKIELYPKPLHLKLFDLAPLKPEAKENNLKGIIYVLKLKKSLICIN